MATIDAFNSYISKLEIDNYPELDNFIKMNKEILMELQTEDEQSRYFENFLKEINLFLKKRKHKE